MSIPIGQKVTVTATGSTTKSVSCEKCKSLYCYEVTRKSSADGASLFWLDNKGAAKRAEEGAAENLAAELSLVVCQ